MKFAFCILLWCASLLLNAQQGFTFIKFTTEDNTGLMSNVVYSLYQDEKGYIWTGTANGLQRFDGSKFVQFGLNTPGSDPFPYSALTQIIPLDSGRLLLNFQHIREFGIFNPLDFSYKKVRVQTKNPVPPKADFFVWKDSHGNVFLNLLRYGVLQFSKTQVAFVDNQPFSFPAGYTPALTGVHEDVVKDQVWFAGEKGLCVFDRSSRQMWHKAHNPKGLTVLMNDTIQDGASQVYIDSRRRLWVCGWPKSGMAGQHKYCLDSTGNRLLTKDTVGLLTGPKGYTEYNYFFETLRAGLWIYGVGTLYNWDRERQRFHYSRSGATGTANDIEYDKVNQLIEDRDGNIWVATNRGLYFTSFGSGTYSVINALFDEGKNEQNIQDILEMPGGELWFASWGQGVIAADSSLNPKNHGIYNTPPPAHWPEPFKAAVKLAWTLFRQPASGDVWIGCQGGVIVIHNPATKQTRYLRPPETNNSTVRFITNDKQGNTWLGTQGGRLIKWDGQKFSVVFEAGHIIYKIFLDREGLLWLATQDKGLYCIEPESGRLVRRWAADGTASGLYSNSGKDIEQLADGTIVYGAGALNFIDKKTGKVRLLRYEDGLPSNSVERLRLDADGFLWIITANGLSRYNPHTGRITTYGRRDGITLASKTNYTDHFSKNGYVMFAGGNALMMFRPAVFANLQPPPNVVITDVRISNQFVPVDSLLQLSHIKLSPDQNSFAIYFSSLSFQQRDRLTYFFKMEGIDKDWQAADGVYFQNYSLLPPGSYTFKVYAVNVEGVRSVGTTEVRIVVKPPFYRSKWFISTAVVLILLVIYFLHRERVNRLLAVEKIRNRVARDLHDDMGSTLSTINILSAMAKSKMSTDPVKTAGYISKISDNSQRMMEAMDDIVWSIKPSNDTLQRVTARMREFATGVLEAKDIALQFTVDEIVFGAKLNMEARRDFFLIFKEALNNAAKYSKATKVAVEVVLQNKGLAFTIKDNGEGFDVAKADSGNGLGNMQKRADGMNGKLRIRSVKGEGTEVKLVVPVGA
ncbi:MAG TPA: two-component regulator propeller domain-containing protein [Flavisolibacter sp.]|nr:two-component regulator propeller domain-containing protein [Flavisolibacter sp.]